MSDFVCAHGRGTFHFIIVERQGICKAQKKRFLASLLYKDAHKKAGVAYLRAILL